MPIVFNAIACTLPLSDGELEVAGVRMGRVITNCITCRTCGTKYSIIVPQTHVDPSMENSIDGLQKLISASCGHHPVIVQNQ
jgi:hypothetical protein